LYKQRNEVGKAIAPTGSSTPPPFAFGSGHLPLTKGRS